MTGNIEYGIMLEILGIRTNTPIIKVWTNNRQDLMKFIYQHDLYRYYEKYPQLIRVTTYPIQTIKRMGGSVYEDMMLREFRFGSESGDDLFTIMTCDMLVQDAIRDVCEELCDSMTFGPCALRGDVELFDKIATLVDELPYACLSDPDYADAMSSADETYDGDDDFAFERDCSITWDAIYDAYMSHPVQPITIEAYIHSIAAQLDQT
jgi:hypothetical protein